MSRKVHWIGWSDSGPDGDDFESYSVCGVGNGKRDCEEWTGARFRSEVTCNNCLNWLLRRDTKIQKSKEQANEQ